MENKERKTFEDLSVEQCDELVRALRTSAELILSQSEASKEEQNLRTRMAELQEENKRLNGRLEDAKEYFLKNKEESAKAETRIRSILARNLQKARDEIYTVGNAVHGYALALSEKPTSKMTLVQVNNLQAALASLIAELEANGLWDPELDLKPDLSAPEKVVKPRQPRKSKIKKSDETMGQQEDLVAKVSDEKPEV